MTAAQVPTPHPARSNDSAAVLTCVNGQLYEVTHSSPACHRKGLGTTERATG